MISWLGFAFEEPPEWEVTGFSTTPDKGRFQFYTRHGFEGELSWRTTKAVPDQERIMTEVMRRHLEEQGETVGTPEMDFRRIGEFTLGTHRSDTPALASRFIESSRLLLEWVFPLAKPELSRSVHTPLLESLTHPDSDPRLWSLFGTSVLLPANFAPEDIQPYPGNVAITYKTPKRHFFTVRRWAMPDELLGPQDLSSFGRVLMAKLLCKVVSAEPTTFQGHEAARIEYKQKGKVGFETIVGQWWPGEAIIFRNREEQRLVCIQQAGPKRLQRLDLEEVWRG